MNQLQRPHLDHVLHTQRESLPEIRSRKPEGERAAHTDPVPGKSVPDRLYSYCNRSKHNHLILCKALPKLMPLLIAEMRPSFKLICTQSIELLGYRKQEIMNSPGRIFM